MKRRQVARGPAVSLLLATGRVSTLARVSIGDREDALAFVGFSCSMLAGDVQCGVMKDFVSQFNFYQVDLIPAQARENRRHWPQMSARY